MSISKKKIKEISQISLVHDVIQSELSEDAHFLENPPDMWSSEQKDLYDLLCIQEDRLKEKILEVLNRKPSIIKKRTKNIKESDNKTISLDDVCHDIVIDEVTYGAIHEFEYRDIIGILLTDAQYEKYTGDCTNRDFHVSQSRINEMIEYINSPDNIWRKKRGNEQK